MTTTAAPAKKTNLMEDIGKIPNKVWNEFKKFSLPKKALIVWLTWFVIDNLTKNLSLSKDDIFENVIELPKKVWTNFWAAPTGKKFFLAVASWYIVKNLFPSEEAVVAPKEETKA